MKKGLFKTLVCIILALIMGLGSPLASIAEEQDGLYLADLKIGYGDDGKASLIANGYKVYDQNVNETGQGKAVYIGYKTTNKTSEAITDIATMNMNGRYSFDKYAKYVQEVIDAANRAAKKFITSVNEFAGKFENGQATTKTTEMAKKALELLNKFKDDDYTDPEGQVSNKLGDMIISGKMTEEELTKIFYQGSSDNIGLIKQLISFGLTEAGNDTFLTRLKTIEYKDSLDASLAVVRTDIFNQIEDLRDYLITAAEYGEAAETYPEGEAAYIQSFDTEKNQDSVTIYIGIYKATKNTQFASNIIMPSGDYMTLFDALTLPTEDEYEAMEEEPECKYTIDNYLVEVLAKALTSGQAGSLDMIPLSTLITNTYYAGSAKKALKNVTEAIKDCGEISVYAGVDRSLFQHPEDVAMTAATIEEMNKGGDNNIGKDVGFWDTNKLQKMYFTIMCAVAGAVGIAFITTAIVRSVKTANYLATWSDLAAAGVSQAEQLTPSCNWVTSLGYTAKTTSYYVAGAFALIIAVALMIALLVMKFEKPSQPKEFTYTKIPRALVHMVEGEENSKQYYNYYAVTRIDASDDDSDYMNVYGDLNGYSTTCQWECLYVTRDSRCGKPLSANIEFVKGSPDTAKNSSNGYLPIHDFDSDPNAASNLNAHTGSDNPTAIYAYAKIAVEPTDTPNQGGSIFESNPVAMSVAALMLGAGLSCGATILITKKRRTA